MEGDGLPFNTTQFSFMEMLYIHLYILWGVGIFSSTTHINVYILTDWSLSFNRSPFSLCLTDEWTLTLSRESLQYSLIVVSSAIS